MTHLTNLRVNLETEKNRLLQKLKQEEEIRDSAPSAMESHSDTTRHRYEESVRNLKNKIDEIDQCLKIVPKSIHSNAVAVLWSKVILETNNQRQEFILVPDGIGGRKLDNGIVLLSTSSPLGKVVLDKRLGDTFTFNQKKFTVLAVTDE